MNPVAIALILLVILVILFIWEPIPIIITAVGASIVYSFFGLVPIADLFKGYNGNNIVLMIGMMVVGSALFYSGITDTIGNAMVKFTGKNERNIIIATMIVSCALSSVCSNMGVIAALAPFVTAICLAAEIGPSKSLLALLFGAQLGGFITLVGVPTNVFASGLLIEHGYEGFSLFVFTPFGLVLCIVGTIYYAFIGSKFIPDTGFVPEFAKAEVHTFDKRKAIIASLTMLGVLIVIAMSPKWLPNHVAAVIGALVIVGSRCMSVQEAVKSIDWNCALFMGALTVVSTGINNSGVGKIVVSLIMNILGEHPTAFMLTTILYFATVIVTQFISNTASILLFMPIAFTLAETLGVNVYSVAMVVTLAGAASYATPFAAPQNMMTTGYTNYKFIDFVKAGTPLVLLTYIVIVILTPIFLPY